MNLQWYPGHMTKAIRMMQENIKLIDLVIELVDARIPLSSRNPEIDKLAANKSRILILNKYDLADEKQNQKWKNYFEEKGIGVAMVNSKSGAGVKGVQAVIEKACKEKIKRDRKRGILNRPIRAMIVGIPNVGKSTFINAFAGKACAKTGNKPGVTKGKQWIRLNKKVELLDTPGVLWPKFEDQEIAKKLAYIGSIKDELVQSIELCLDLMNHIASEYPNAICHHYEVEYNEDKAIVLEEIARSRGDLMKGEELDLEKTSRRILDDFQNGRIERITLEQPRNGE